MKITITIQMDNAAFDPDNGSEVARILENLRKTVEYENLRPGWETSLWDINGNKVGKAEVK